MCREKYRQIKRLLEQNKDFRITQLPFGMQMNLRFIQNKHTFFVECPIFQQSLQNGKGFYSR